MTCANCRVGSFQPGKMTQTLERDGSIGLIKDVPAQICDTCGNYTLSAENTRLVLARASDALEGSVEASARFEVDCVEQYGCELQYPRETRSKKNISN